MAPGRLLHRLAKLLLPATRCEQAIEPQLADFQHEFPQADRRAQRVAVLVSGYLAFWFAFLICMPDVLRKGLFAIPRCSTSLLVMQMSFWLAFAISLGAAVSWVRTGTVSWADVLTPMRHSPLGAFLPALIVSYCRSRAERSTQATAALAMAVAILLVVILRASPSASVRTNVGYAVFFLLWALLPRTVSERQQ